MSLLFQVPEMVVTCMQHMRRRQRMLRSLQGTIEGTVPEQVKVPTSGGRVGFQVGAHKSGWVWVRNQDDPPPGPPSTSLPRLLLKILSQFRKQAFKVEDEKLDGVGELSLLGCSQWPGFGRIAVPERLDGLRNTL